MKYLLSLLTLLAIADFSYAGDLCKQNSFTKAQAVQGRWEYDSSCGLCHQFNLQGRLPGNFQRETPGLGMLDATYIKTIDGNGGMIPPLLGAAFFRKWKDQTAFSNRITDAIHGFPPKNYIKDESDARIAAYIAFMNCGKM